jgi:hypothetical protein
MFKTTPAAEPAPIVTPPADLVPISHLALDLPEPSVGWLIELDRRHIDVLVDDIGRKAISRSDARGLLDERREDELRRQEAAARNEARAVEQDRLRRASIWRGLPAVDLPVGVSASSAMLQAAKDSEPKRMSPLQEALSGESLTYHSYQTSPEDAA